MSLIQKKHMHQLLIEFELEDLKKYVEKTEDFLKSELENFNEKFEEETKNWSQEERDEYGETLSDEYWTMADTHPNIFRASMLMNIYSLFENQLKRLCSSYERKYKKKISLKNSRNTSKINKFREKLEIMLEINLPEENNCWKMVDEVYREVRNILVHDGGEIHRNKLDEVRTIINNVSSIKLDDRNAKIILSNQACLEFIEQIECFYDLLFKEIKCKKR
ncbi:hypothetical protein C1N83_00195 [Priestia aryabhattai]